MQRIAAHSSSFERTNMQNTSQLRDESAASALRVFAGNGFGDAAIGRTEPHDFYSASSFTTARARALEPPEADC